MLTGTHLRLELLSHVGHVSRVGLHMRHHPHARSFHRPLSRLTCRSFPVSHTLQPLGVTDWLVQVTGAIQLVCFERILFQEFFCLPPLTVPGDDFGDTVLHHCIRCLVRHLSREDKYLR